MQEDTQPQEPQQEPETIPTCTGDCKIKQLCLVCICETCGKFEDFI